RAARRKGLAEELVIRPFGEKARTALSPLAEQRLGGNAGRLGETVGGEGVAPIGIALPEEVAGDLGDVAKAPLARRQRGAARLERGARRLEIAMPRRQRVGHPVEAARQRREFAGRGRDGEALAESAGAERLGDATEPDDPMDDGQLGQQPGADDGRERDDAEQEEEARILALGGTQYRLA